MNLLDQRKKLFALLSLLLIAGFVAAGAMSYIVSRNTVRDAIINRELPLTGESIYSEIQRDILKPIFVSKQMAENTFLRDWAINGEKDVQSVSRYLDEIKRSNAAITSFFVSEKSHNYYTPTGIFKKVSETDEKDRWYFRVRNMAEPYEISSDPDAVNKNRLTVFINYRVMGYQGEYIGVTGVGLASEALAKLIAQYEIKFGRRISFVDPKGQIIITSKGAAQVQGNLVHQPGMKDVATKVLNGSAEQTKLVYELDGSTVHLNSRLVPELSWYLLVEEDEARALAPLTRVLWLSLLIGALATFAALSLVLYVVKRFQAQLVQLATTDKLSGLANRQTGEAQFTQAVAEASKNGKPLSLIVFDVDHFKRINDNYGHLTGDQVISRLAQEAQQLVRGTDTLVRWGGEEFMLLLPATAREQAYEIAERLLKKVEAMRLRIGDEHREGQAAHADELQLTISAGVAQCFTGEAPAAFFSRADAALYKAKQAGRNRVEIV